MEDIYKLGNPPEPLENLLEIERWPNLAHEVITGPYVSLAEEMYHRKTTEGYLGTISIYHQLLEQFILHILKQNDLYFKIKMWPVNWGRSGDLDKTTIGRYIPILRDTVDFMHKDDFIEAVDRFNKQRNNLMHGIFQLEGEEEIKSLATRAYQTFNKQVIPGYSYGYNHMQQLLHKERLKHIKTK